MKEKLELFLKQYVGQGELKKDKVYQKDVDSLVDDAIFYGIEQEIIDYGKEHPDAPFWEFLELIPEGLFGVTQEELLEDDE